MNPSVAQEREGERASFGESLIKARLTKSMQRTKEITYGTPRSEFSQRWQSSGAAFLG